MNDSMVPGWPREVLKRSGLREAFNADKIRSALARAGQRIGAVGGEAARQVAQFREVLQAHGQDVDKHPSVEWSWSPVERGGE